MSILREEGERVKGKGKKYLRGGFLLGKCLKILLNGGSFWQGFVDTVVKEVCGKKQNRVLAAGGSLPNL